MRYWHAGKALAAVAASVFFGALLVLTACSPQSRQHAVVQLQGSTMGTTWQVQIATPSDAPGQTGSATDDRLSAEIQALLDRLDYQVFSTWSAESELSQLSQAPIGKARVVSPDLLEVLLQSQELHALSLGTFDITVGALVNLWGFGPDPAAWLPDASAVQRGKAQQGMEALAIDRALSAVTLHKPLALDLSAIAKGYATDQVAELLLARGHTDFIVEIGGELRVQGLRADARPWRIAIERPQGGPREAYTRISSQGEALALAGSGDYRQSRMADGRLYSHEIDPESGYPVTHPLASVTVISHSAALADAWATALLVLGPAAGPALAERNNLAAYFIVRGERELESFYTPAFTRFLDEE